ncbi:MULTISPECIES: GNAT family N-acetyltransferase [Streptomyces]|uniref:GNAT family N-acetyltransferase n=1 Tax=Streptomyces sanyensis TaxID=568869 RepID=A0ABP9BGG4_9ACTN
MTTTLRPTGPIRRSAGALARDYDVCVNGRPVGAVALAAEPGPGLVVGRILALHIEPPDRGRGRGTVAALAAEEVLRGWDCAEVRIAVGETAEPALRLAGALGYTARARTMAKGTGGPPPALPDGAEARPLDPAGYDRWREAAVGSFARTLAAQGFPESAALAHSERAHAGLLPEGLATPGTRILYLYASGERVGRIWVAERDTGRGEREAFVFDVEVAEPHRGRGHGRTLMLLAERTAREAGLDRVGLNVFEGNTPALRLYESLGYRTTHRNLAKRLL